MEEKNNRIRTSEETENMNRNQTIMEKLKAYMGVQFMMRNINEDLLPYVITISGHAVPAKNEEITMDGEYENIVCTSDAFREEIAKELNVPTRNVSQIIYRLTKHGILHSVFDKEGKKVRTLYYVADWILRRDEWSSVLDLGKKGKAVNYKARIVIDDSLHYTPEVLYY